MLISGDIGIFVQIEVNAREIIVQLHYRSGCTVPGSFFKRRGRSFSAGGWGDRPVGSQCHRFPARSPVA